MKNIIILLSLSAILAGCCGNRQQPAVLPQVSESDVVAAVNQLMNVMVNVDESVLQSIIADELVYGHSGGKVQNKSEFIAEMLAGDPFVYPSVETLNQTIQLAGDAAVVRHIFTAETKNLAGEPGSLRVGIMMVWKLQDGTLKLLARQAYRLPEV